MLWAQTRGNSEIHEVFVKNIAVENGGEKVDHGSGGMSPLRAA